MLQTDIHQQIEICLMMIKNSLMTKASILIVLKRTYQSLPTLRKQIIHNDANEWNTLTLDNQISGIIDFGDVCYSQLINELAIALAYSLLGKKDPIKWAVHIISEYNKILPLEEKEIDILYWLIAARLTTTVCNSAYERIQRPENSYIQISEKSAWELLKIWVNINPKLARDEFQKAIDTN